MSPYQPLAEVRQNLKVKWYRTKIDSQKLKELSARSDAQGWLQAGGHLALFMLTGAATYLLWSQGLWLGFLVALFLHGTVASFFVGVAPHELGHGSVFKTKWLNKAFLYIFSFLAWWDPFDFASSHTYHHRYTLHPEGDRENLLPLEPSLRSTFVLQLFTINLLTQRGRTFGKGGLISTLWVTLLGAVGRVGDPVIPINEWIQALHDDQPDEYRRSIAWSRLLLAGHGTIALVSLLTGYWVFILLISVAPFIANWLAYLVGLPQHCGLMENVPDFRKSVRSMRLPVLVEFLYWRMNWHTEHHMYVSIPCYHLKKLHQEVAHDMPKPRTLVEAWREMRLAWQRQQLDPAYVFDTPLPPTAQLAYWGATEGDDEPRSDLDGALEALAPKGLSH
jgi:fatty acid desaturase